ncbi:ORF6N domain-containing protein [Clostridium sp.]|uniref:ORF6N domain-containing protein n=1 Tax=Clostridium sp. TaxID=1506 RepID=UPI001D6B73FA|nr:ORF6N domain-containing protein [Clostridium sp.]MBS5307707.1 ORF6N domain-containing protein [Clostridium sp.]MDU3410025.1 ORF6N domain-containing protein [Clostridium sp.]
MKELIVKGKQNFMGMDIPVVYGGFGENQKVILARDIAKIHEVELKKINEIINNNLDEFEEGVDILDFKNSVFPTGSLFELGISKQSIANSKNIYLLSEQGYLLLVGFMKTEKAKEVRKQFRREYFKMKEVVISESKTEIEKSNSALELVAKIDKKINDLGQYYKPSHKKKLDINKYIKQCLGTNANKENCDKVKEILLTQLGCYKIYDEVPIDILHNSETAKKIFDICYMISCNDGQIQMNLNV